MDKATYLLDQFVGVRLGTPYRLFPFGNIFKGGKKREITPEMAALFRLPHFKPAIKLGSHDEPTPAGGHIVALEVRDDGLYAVPEWNEKGETAIQDGAYRYHSPEVIWEGGGFEDPASGDIIEGPLIVGDALLHAPHLGEAARLYSVEPIQGEQTMTEETVKVPNSFWETLVSKLTAQPEPVVLEQEPVADTEEYKAVVQERDDYKAKWEAHEAEKERAALIEKYEGELKETKADPALAEILAGLPEADAQAITRQIKALSAQAENVEAEIGSEGQAIEDPAAAFDAAVKTIQIENKVGYAAALALAKEQHKDLFDAYLKAKE